MLALACAFAAPAMAAEQIETFTVTPATSQAGGHPDLTVEFALEKPGDPEAASSALLEPPAGQLLAPNSVPDCSGSDFTAASCASDTQVGSVMVRGVREGNDDFLFGTAAVYDVEAENGDYGRLGFVIPTIDIPILAPLTLRSDGDYGLRIDIQGLPANSPLRSASLRLWGEPANTSHDAERLPMGTTGCPGAETLGCGSPVASPAPARPFTLYPTRCLGSPSWRLDVRTAQDPDTPSTRSAGIPTPTGCDQLSFNPSAFLTLGAAVTGSATSMDLTVNDPLQLSPTIPMPSPLYYSATDFHGLVAVDRSKLAEAPVCSTQEAGVGVAGPASCPEASKLGTATVESPLLLEPVSGGLYYGGAVGNGAYLVFLTASGEGLDFKTELLLEAGASGGVTLLEAPSLPQFPISGIQMQFAAGPAIMRAGSRCGTHTAKTLVVPWDIALSPQVLSNSAVLTRPGGAACAGEAAAIDVEAEPSSLPADGASTGTVTARIVDESEVPVVGDEVEFEAGDPNVQIGPVLENEDGTYSASVTASTTPGPVTITATDRELEPELRGETEIVLASLAKPPPPPGGGSSTPPLAAPRTTIGSHPSHRSRKRRATFTFSADVPGSAFSYKLDSKPYRGCASPLKLSGLKPGPHTLRVFATGPSGLAGPPAIFAFTVRPPPPARRHKRKPPGA